MKSGKAMAVAGSWLQLGLIVGPAVTGVSLVGTYRAMSEATDSELPALWNEVGSAYGAYLLGVGVAFLGLILIGFALFRRGVAEPWLFHALAASGCIWLVFFPGGTVIGAAILVTIFWRRDRFESRPEGSVAGGR